MHKQIFNIPAGQPFARTLAECLLRETQGKPEVLTQQKIFLPTRRACRVLRDTFLSLNDGKPLLLPRLMPLGDVEEEELSLLVFGHDAGFLDIPPAITPLKRQILLARMISANPDFAQGMDFALSLAQELGRFIDQVIIEELDFSELEKIVPAEFAAHWQITIDFLKIITENWPKILAENNVIDGALRRNMLMEALARYWQDRPPQEPIIAAGSTGSIPATARLLGVISMLPKGRVILPGLDQEMDEQSWLEIREGHAQYGLKQLLKRMEFDRKEVRPFAGEKSTVRGALASEMMRPAETTQEWKKFANGPDLERMLAGLEYYPCKTQQEEAQVVALVMREALEDRQKIAALITPDRGLARRVSALCRRWGIEVDDSAGQNLRESRIGKYALLVLQIIQGDFDPVVLLALLKNEFCGLGTKDIVTLEKQFLRQNLILPDIETLCTEIENSMGVQHDLSQYMKAFRKAIEPLEPFKAGANHGFMDVITAHLQVMEVLANKDQISGAQRLWSAEEGEAAASFFTDLQHHGLYFPLLSLTEYAGILDQLMGVVTVRSPYGAHPRISILGQLEARLTSADIIVLGGLNEKVWPPDSGHDPWLSRPMRKAFGLPAAEKSVGLAAHDFVQGFCGPRVIMTRSQRLEGSPSVPARWLLRLETVLKACGRSMQELSRYPYAHWAESIDHREFNPCEPPSPRPPIAARPDGISITRVEQWLRDPYSIYAGDVLRLRKLLPLVQENDLALRGTLLHEILDRFIKTFPLELPEDAEHQLIAIARDIFAARLQDQDALRYWWPRFLKISEWVVMHERQWRQKAKYLESELEGNADIDVDGLAFNLQGKPDRIDRMAGGYGIIDYKSGSNYKASKLAKGELPQMPLAAMILMRGGFDGKGLRYKSPDPDKKRVPAAPVHYMGYWNMTGGTSAGEEQCIEDNLDAVIDIVEEGLKAMVRAFRQPETAYLSVPDTSNPPRYNDYEQLARLKEWAALDESLDEDPA